MPHDPGKDFSFHRTRYFNVTSDKNWRRIAATTLIILALLIIGVAVFLLWYFAFRNSDAKPNDQNPATGSPATEHVGCFPSESTVVTPFGRKRMDQLELGDQVLDLDSDGRCCRWTSIYAFSFVDDYTRILTRILISDKRVLLTPNHLVFRIGSRKFQDVQAGDIRVGDSMVLKNSTGRVTGVQSIFGRGAHSPFTRSGSLLVDDVWVSCFAGHWLSGRVGHDHIQKYFMAPLRFLATLIDKYGDEKISEFVLRPKAFHLWYVRLLKAMHSIVW